MALFQQVEITDATMRAAEARARRLRAEAVTDLVTQSLSALRAQISAAIGTASA